MDNDKLHADPTVRAALLAYHDRPGDKEGNAVVQAVIAKLPGMPADEWLKQHERLALVYGSAEYDSGYADGDGGNDLNPGQSPDATRAALLENARLRIQPAAREAETPTDDKAHPRFMAGYDAGLKDGRVCERRDASTDGCILVRQEDTEHYVHPQYGPGIFLTEDCILSAPPSAPAAEPILQKVDTIIASINSAHHAKRDDWKAACFAAADQALGELKQMLPAPAAEPVAQNCVGIIEQIAQEWDGCKYDSVGTPISIGDAIRSAGSRLMREARLALAAESAEPECPTCKGTGQMCVGSSGREDDGNALEFEPCGECGYGDTAATADAAESAEPVAPDSEAIAEAWISASDIDGIAYDGPSFERGYVLGEIAERDKPTAATADARGDERAAFKAWYVNRYDREPDMGQGGAIGRWEAWQAARALSRQPSAAASALDQYSYQQLFDAIAAAISASELVAIRVSVEAFRAALAAAKPEGGSHE